MKLVARSVLGAALSMCPALIFAAQSEAPKTAPVRQPEVEFHFERAGVSVPRFTLRVYEDGTGSYQADEAESASDGGEVRYAAPKHIDRTLSLTPATTARIFKTARELRHFDMDCASKAKNIANTGKKTLSYAGSDGTGSCTYNYSDNKDVEMLTATFLAIALTLDEGRSLEHVHRYDRLGLDAETISLEQEAAAGRAIELETIAPVLNSIAEDMTVMQRVRLRVAKLLEKDKLGKR